LRVISVMRLLGVGLLLSSISVFSQRLEIDRMVWDQTLGVARRIYFQAVGGTDPLRGQSPFQILNQYARSMGLGNLTAQMKEEKRTVGLSAQAITYRQTALGLPVYRGEVIVSINSRGEAVSIVNNAVLPPPNLENANFRVTPETTDQAVRTATQRVSPGKRVILTAKPFVEIYVKNGKAHVAYRVSFVTADGQDDWRVWVDAQTGEYVDQEYRTLRFQNADGKGRVFNPDPRSVLRNEQLKDSNDQDLPEIQSTYVEVDLKGLNAPRSNQYVLQGQFASSQEFESPSVTMAKETSPVFKYKRNDPRFEETMVYFHLDQSQRYIQSLGFDGSRARGIQNGPIAFDAHGLNGTDNSHFIPSLNRLAFGDGGVDDAEDTDVILHEYGHAIQTSIHSDWGGDEQGAMGEGFGDYWATAYTRPLVPEFHPEWVFMWDGHNEFWPGRALNTNKHYPEDVVGQEIHMAGELWSQTLTEIREAVGDFRKADQLILDHHIALGSRATMVDAARSLLVSDQNLFGGVHVEKMKRVFEVRGLKP
jgi:hypothetical protein